MAIKAVIYDVDGTLVDSEPLHVAAWDEALKQYDHTLQDLSKEFIRTMAGKKPIVIAAEMVSVLKLDLKPDIFLEIKAKAYLALARTNLKETEGAIASVKRLKQAGYRLAIGTSLDRDLLNSILGTFSIKNSFEVIVTGDQIKKGKPDPETYLKVIELLGLLPRECVVIEDAQSGIESAKVAGTYCIAIENPHAITQDTSRADIVLSSLTKLTKSVLDTIA